MLRRRPTPHRGTLSVELRSVNARYLDLQFRISDELRALEPMLRELIGAQRLARQARLPHVSWHDAAGAAGRAAA